MNTYSNQFLSYIIALILLHEKFLHFDWLRAVILQLNLRYLHVNLNYKPCVDSSILTNNSMICDI